MIQRIDDNEEDFYNCKVFTQNKIMLKNLKRSHG